MSSALALVSQHSAPVNALLMERLAQVEATLEEAKLRVVSSLDRELASVRGWLTALQTFDPTLTMDTTGNQEAQGQGEATIHSMMEQAPQPAKSNIVAFHKGDFESTASPVQEPEVDPGLEKATVDELNAALDAAFREMEKSGEVF